MNKTDFLKLLSNRANVSYYDCKKLINESKNLIEEVCYKGETLRLRGFGKFYLKERLSRRTFNPQTKRYYYSKNKIFIDFAPTKKIAKHR